MSGSRKGQEAMQWNVGGWFGGQLGATLWMLILGCTLLMQGETAGWVLVLGGLAANAAGLLLWSQRHHLRAHFGVQMLFLACGCAAALALFGVARIADPGLLVQWRLNPWYLLVYPAVMLLVFSLDRGNRSVDPEAGSRGGGNRDARES